MTDAKSAEARAARAAEREKEKSAVVCEVLKDAMVCSDAKILGAGGIKVGQGTTVHPMCLIHAKAGPIEIGNFCCLEEQVEIVNNTTETLVIGDYNVFEVGARVQGGHGAKIGHGNVIEARAHLGLGVKIGNGCTVTAMTKVNQLDVLEDETVLIGPTSRHKEVGATEAHMKAAKRLFEILKETIPRAHHLRKSQGKVASSSRTEKAEKAEAPPAAAAPPPNAEAEAETAEAAEPEG